MKVSRGGSFVAGVVVMLIVGGGTAVASGGVSITLGKGNVVKTTTGLRDTKGTPLSLTAKKGYPPLKVNSPVEVKNLNAALLDGRSAGDFLPATGTAGNAALLGGQPASAFLGAGATAVNATQLAGQPASAFLGAGATAANASQLAGQPAAAYLTTVYSASTTKLQDPVPLSPVVKLDVILLPPGTYSIRGDAVLQNDQTATANADCVLFYTWAPTGHTSGTDSEVTLPAANGSETETFSATSTAEVITVTKTTSASLECSRFSGSSGVSVTSSIVTATQVGSFVGTPVSIN